MRPLGAWWLLAALALPGCRGAAPAPPDSAPRLRVLAYNIRHGQGMDGRVDLARIAALIRRLAPDVVTLQEVDQGTARTSRVDQAAELGRLTGMHAVFGPFMPYQGGEYGMAILSRRPALAVDNHRLPDGAEPRTALAVRLEHGSPPRPIVVVGVHLYRTEAERLAQADAVLAALAGEPAPVLLAGDFNSRPDSPVMARLADRFAVVAKRGGSATFPADAPDREIDFVLLRPAAAFEVLDCRVVAEAAASDHRPVLLDLRLRDP